MKKKFRKKFGEKNPEKIQEKKSGEKIRIKIQGKISGKISGKNSGKKFRKKVSFVLTIFLKLIFSFRDNQPLKVAILPSYLVAHQAHALKLCNWLMELFAKSSGFRALFFQVLMTEDPKIDSERETKTFMEKLLTTSAITWKSVRKAWMELVVEVALKTPENKIKLGEVYLKHYQSLMNDYMNDDQEPDVSIVNLTVQILTVPSVAHHLVEKSNALAELVEYFTTIFNDEARYVDGKIDLCEWLEEKTYDYKRFDHILTDIGNIQL